MVTDTNFQLKDFERDVLAYSHKIPVLADFWAGWCSPCKFLGPVVEKLANKAHGHWKLVKINIEDNESIAADWGIRSIPNLKLFYGGEVIDEVSGAISEEDLANWLAEKLPSTAKLLTMEAARLIKSGKVNLGIKKLEQALAEDDKLEEAKLLMAKQRLWQAPDEVADILAGIHYLESAKEILLIAEVLKMKKGNLKEGTSRNEVLRGFKALRQQDIGKALEHLINAVMTNRWYADELARRLVIALFHYLGESNKLTRNFRRKFDLALY
jgi:putative thioredoxin